MTQNRMRKQTENTSLKRAFFLKKDDGVSSVVGEMLLLAIGVILVAVFATSLMGLLPGDRDDHVDVAMYSDVSNQTIMFYHKGGDAIKKEELRVQVYQENSVSPRYCEIISLKDSAGKNAAVFNLGCVFTVSVSELSPNNQVRLMTDNTIIYTGVVKGEVSNDTEA